MFHYYARWCMTYICSYFAIITGEQSGKIHNLPFHISLPFANFGCVYLLGKKILVLLKYFCMRVLQQFPKWRKILNVTHKIHEDQKGNFRFTECMPNDVENLFDILCLLYIEVLCKLLILNNYFYNNNILLS